MNLSSRLRRRDTVALLAASLAAPALRAQAYPSRPVHLIVGYSAGGAVDAVARSLGQALSQQLGQPFIVDNKPGAGTNIAVKAAIDAAPDGYTLLVAANALAANMALYQPQPFDAERDLAPIALIGRVPVVLAANAQAPYQNLRQLVEAAKAKPDTINFASPGNGSTPHMAVELFERTAGIRLQHVPYKGGTQAITDVIGGQVPLVAMNALEVQPHAKSGRLKVLAVLSAKRSAVFPDVPTLAESGYPGFDASVWYALLAPKATPAAVVTQLHDAVQKALQAPAMRERMTQVGGEVLPGTTAALAQLLHADRVRYEKLVREAGIRPD